MNDFCPGATQVDSRAADHKARGDADERNDRSRCNIPARHADGEIAVISGTWRRNGGTRCSSAPCLAAFGGRRQKDEGAGIDCYRYCVRPDAHILFVAGPAYIVDMNGRTLPLDLQMAAATTRQF